MKITYDSRVDAAYIYIVESIGAGGVSRTVPVDPREINGMINLDFDDRGQLLGVEVIDASHLLSAEVLRLAE